MKFQKFSNIWKKIIARCCRLDLKEYNKVRVKIIQYFTNMLYLYISKNRKINVNPEEFGFNNLVTTLLHLEWG